MSFQFLIDFGNIADWFSGIASIVLATIALWPVISKRIIYPKLKFILHPMGPVSMGFVSQIKLNSGMEILDYSRFEMLYGVVKNQGLVTAKNFTVLMDGYQRYPKETYKAVQLPVGMPINLTNLEFGKSDIKSGKNCSVDLFSFVRKKVEVENHIKYYIEGNAHFVKMIPNNYYGAIFENNHIEFYFRLSADNLKKDVFFSIELICGEESFSPEVFVSQMKIIVHNENRFKVEVI
jgi:hypothetical protein